MHGQYIPNNNFPFPIDVDVACGYALHQPILAFSWELENRKYTLYIVPVSN
jgi:hypothetical protein